MILDYYLYFIIVILTVKHAFSLPFQPLLSSIVRRNHPGDLLFPTVCHSLCRDLFHAVDSPSNDSAPCSCSCPPEAPVYLNTAGSCVARIDECHDHIRFSPSEFINSSIPVISLPSHNGIILPKNSILWQETGISVSPNGSVNCSIRSVYFDNIHHRWKNHKTALFRLSLVAYHTVLVFTGSDVDSASLTGSVVQMKLKCDDYHTEYCLALRISGISGANPSSLSHMKGADLTKFIIIIIIFILSFLTTFIVWRFCWKRKKRRLISDYQMKYLYQLRQQQHMQKIENDLRREYSVEEGDLQIERPPSNNNKARLFFSAEYLEPDLMLHPPQMALQFLFDLRRMVDIAKERIKIRRFCPILNTIREEEKTVEKRETALPVAPILASELPSPPVDFFPPSTSPVNNSPRSFKSIDSGRESKEEEEEEGSNTDENEEIDREEIRTNINVKNIVNGFESRSSCSSQLPVLKKPAALPRTQPRPASQIPTLIGQASPRPQPRQLSVNKEENNNNTGGKNSYKVRKGYSVFPADPMLHKSLPRRKKSIPVPIATTRQAIIVENNR